MVSPGHATPGGAVQRAPHGPFSIGTHMSKVHMLPVSPAHTDAMPTPPLAHLGSQIVACGQVFEPVQTVPVSRSSSARVVVDHLGTGKAEVGRTERKPRPWEACGDRSAQSSLASQRSWGQGKDWTDIPPSRVPGSEHGVGSDLHLPECVGAGGRGGRLAQRGSQEHLQLALVLIASEELLLLCVEQPHHVSLWAGAGSGIHSHAPRLRVPQMRPATGRGEGGTVCSPLPQVSVLQPSWHR